jgi:hypothetical protein
MAKEPTTVDQQIYLELRAINTNLSRIVDCLKELTAKVGKV